MQRLEVSGAVRPLYGSLGVKRLIITLRSFVDFFCTVLKVLWKVINHSLQGGGVSKIPLYLLQYTTSIHHSGRRRFRPSDTSLYKTSSRPCPVYRIGLEGYIVPDIETLEQRRFNPLNADLIPCAICWHYWELTIFSTLAG